MKEVLDKLSSYNIFNYLLPGIIFTCIAQYFTRYNFTQENIFIGAFLYYFIGMIISRFGSIIIEPILKKISFLKFEDYKKFVDASKKDAKIEILSEVNNTYRTITAMVFLLMVLKGYSYLESQWNIPKELSYFLILVLLFFMFLFSYRKQTNYISKRVRANS